MGSKARRTPLWTILLVAVCTLLLAGGQVLMKHSLRHPDIMLTLTDLTFWGGLLLLVLTGLAIPFAMKYGELSVLHPVIALGFIWATLLGALTIGEIVPVHRMLGIGIIVFGVSLIGHGGHR